MKRFKKMMAIAIVAVMTLAYAMPMAFASTLTINNGVEGFTYEAYQIFTGDKSGNAGAYKLANIQWGNAIPSDQIANFLADNDLETLLGVTDGALAGKTAAQLAELIKEKNGADLADIVGKYATVKYGDAATYANSKYTFSGLPDGYYLVKNTAKDDSTAKEYTYSEYIMEIVGDTTAEAKNDSVSVEKKIDADTSGNTIDDAADTDSNSVAIGDTIPYIIEGELPSNFAQYKNYYFKFSDTMKGIDYVSGDVATTTTKTESSAKVYVVTAAGAATDITNKATITPVNQTTKEGSTTLTIEIENLKASDLGVTVAATDKIVVKYWGQLNNFADTGTTANVNEVDLTYTNNPEQSGSGTPGGGGEPEYKTATGTTPKSETKTYDTVLKVLKIGDNNDSTLLEGAKFKLTGDNLYTVREVNGYKFVPSTYELSTAKGVSESFEAGTTYYALKDTNDPTNVEKYTYTTTPCSNDLDAATKAKYVDQTNATTYKKVNYTATVTEKPASGTATYTGYTNASGELSFEGLEPGTYQLTELIAPTGYNLLSAPVEVEIAFDDSDAKKFTTTSENTTVAADGTIQIKINNNGGQTLPSTGGIGTTLFYLIGGILVIGAGVVLVTRRRVGTEE